MVVATGLEGEFLDLLLLVEQHGVDLQIGELLVESLDCRLRGPSRRFARLPAIFGLLELGPQIHVDEGALGL